jgi:predicted small secreted protein
MKKSKLVTLVLITAALASCNKTENQQGAGGDWDDKTDKKVYMRSDSTARYTRTHHHGVGTALLWYYAFRPYGSSGYNNGYNRTGFYSRGLSRSSNVGSNSVKSTISRGGFGGRAFSRSSAT